MELVRAPVQVTLEGMRMFSVGEEVIYDGEVYVVSKRSESPPLRYRLLASRPDGTRFIWAQGEQLRPIESYLESRDDTATV